MDPHPLQVFLQAHLASDASAVLYLPNVLPALLPHHFDASSHLQKWIARVNSLIHAKDAGARWAGLSLATQTSIMSRPLMMENAQSWTGAAMPLLSKSEPAAVLKAAVRLLLHMFSAALDIPEFQRQLATPNVPKFSAALLALAEKHENHAVKLFALDTLVALIPLFPTLHKALHGPLTGLCLRQLNGSAPQPTNAALLEAASRLYAVLPVTGGKVGAAALWRKELDETLAFAWTALLSVRTTFPHDARLYPPRSQQPSNEDPLVTVPLNIDRLRCATVILSDLLKFATARPVQVPVGALVKFCQALLSCTPEEKREQGFVDPSTRGLEEAAIPELWSLGCRTLIDLSTCIREHLSSSIPRFASILVFHLERSLTSKQRVYFLRGLISALTYSPALHHPILPTRITKTLLAILSILLPSQAEAQGDAVASATKSRKGKKRARDYEGDEVFKMADDVMCSSLAEGEMVLAAFDALCILLRNPYVAPATHSLACRFLLSVNASLPLLPPSQLSRDLHLHGRVLDKVQALSLEIGEGTSSAMSKSLGLVIHELRSAWYPQETDPQRALDLLIHPRLPPLVRSLPHVETLSLFRAEESTEEKEVREGLDIGAFGTHAAEAVDATAPVSATPAWSATSFTAPHMFPPQQLRLQPPTAPPSNPSVTSTSAPIQATAVTVPSAPAVTALPSITPVPASSSKVDAPLRVPASQPVAVPMDEDVDDEEIPSIDMGSDSE
ncbi:hypothetical protein FA95DRAFT_1555880 [Auriscalpium vulgare]|uniref:Uncharacterized protein n=1 Tax=Auriscalpium vulgare TaxID=40419 RepID=A0ACB8S1F7_9AGAM|nr:hypothetical protein FA95DRAFT_1555880 [Auriscalpium vulgare]